MAFFDFSGLRLLLEKSGKPSQIYFWVDDLDAAYHELRTNGVDFQSDPILIHKDIREIFGKPTEEEWMAFFSDPSGNTPGLVTRRPSAQQTE